MPIPAGIEHHPVGGEQLDVNAVPRPERWPARADHRAAHRRLEARAAPDRPGLRDERRRDPGGRWPRRRDGGPAGAGGQPGHEAAASAQRVPPRTSRPPRGVRRPAPSRVRLPLGLGLAGRGPGRWGCSARRKTSGSIPAPEARQATRPAARRTAARPISTKPCSTSRSARRPPTGRERDQEEPNQPRRPGTGRGGPRPTNASTSASTIS